MDGAAILYKLTRGHPALVHELLNQEQIEELLQNDAGGLQSRLLFSEHIKLLRRHINGDAALKQLLQRLLSGDTLRCNSAEEDHLYWLGIITEQDADHWRWSAPILRHWADSE
jgi:hypothetical protein